jgi:hypothetical protein
LILSCYETAHLLILIRTSGDGYSLLGSKNSLRCTIVYFLNRHGGSNLQDEFSNN